MMENIKEYWELMGNIKEYWEMMGNVEEWMGNDERNDGKWKIFWRISIPVVGRSTADFTR